MEFRALYSRVSSDLCVCVCLYRASLRSSLAAKTIKSQMLRIFLRVNKPMPASSEERKIQIDAVAQQRAYMASDPQADSNTNQIAGDEKSSNQIKRREQTADYTLRHTAANVENLLFAEYARVPKKCLSSRHTESERVKHFTLFHAAEVIDGV